MTLPELKTLPTHADIERLIALLRDIKKADIENIDQLPVEIKRRIQKELDDYEV